MSNGVSILVVGLVVGFVMFLPALTLTSSGSAPFAQLANTLLTVPQLYPVAAVGGIFSIGSLVLSRR